MLQKRHALYILRAKDLGNVNVTNVCLFSKLYLLSSLSDVHRERNTLPVSLACVAIIDHNSAVVDSADLS